MLFDPHLYSLSGELTFFDCEGIMHLFIVLYIYKMMKNENVNCKLFNVKN